MSLRAYSLIRWGGAPRLALPRGDHPLQTQGLCLFRGHSIRGRLLSGALKLAAVTGTLDLLASRVELPSPHLANIDWRHWIDSLFQQLGHEPGSAAFYLPYNRELRRVVALLLRDDASPIGLVKMGLSAETESVAKREAATIKRLSCANLQAFKVPKILLEGDCEGHYYFVQAPVRGSYPPHYRSWNALFERIAVELSHIGEAKGSVDDFEWWPCFLRAAGPLKNSLCAAIAGTSGQFRTVLGHGDFAPWNMSWDGRDLCIYDWEESEDNVPLMSDRILFLARVIRAGRIPAALRAMHQQMGMAATSVHTRDIALAVAHLARRVDNEILEVIWKEAAKLWASKTS